MSIADLFIAIVLSTLIGILVLFSLSSLRRLCICLLVSDLASQFLKRAIFLVGSQTTFTYYLSQSAPYALELFALLILWRSRRKIPRAGRLLLLFAALGLLTTLAAPDSGSFQARALAIAQVILPCVFYFVGFRLTAGDIAALAKCYLCLAFVAAPYALIQFVGGPTVLDRVWAENTADYSIQAQKVMPVLSGLSTDFRPSSFYADPFTWSLVIFAGITLLLAAHSMGLLSRVFLIAGLVVSFISAFVTLSRSSIAGIVGIFLFFVLLGIPRFRSAPVLLGFLGIAFFASDSLSQFLITDYASWNIGSSDHVVQRYSEIGTLDARAHSISILSEIGASGFIGKGYAFSFASVARGLGVDAPEELTGSHSIIVELIVNVGYVGLLIFTAFLFLVFKRALPQCGGRLPHSIAMRWLAAGAMAHLFVGLVSGPGVLTFHFYLILGLLTRGLAVKGSSERPLERLRLVPVIIDEHIVPV